MILDFEDLDIRPLTDDELDDAVGGQELGVSTTAPS